MLILQVGFGVLLVLSCTWGLVAGQRTSSLGGLRRYFGLMLSYGVLVIVQGLNTDPILERVLLGLQLVVVATLLVTVTRLVRQKKERTL